MLLLEYQELRKAAPPSEHSSSTTDSRTPPTTDGSGGASASPTPAPTLVSPTDAAPLVPRRIDINLSKVESRKHFRDFPNATLSPMKLETTEVESILTVAVQSSKPDTYSYLFSPVRRRDQFVPDVTSAYLVNNEGHQYALIRDSGTWSGVQYFDGEPRNLDAVRLHKIDQGVVYTLKLYFEPLPVDVKGLRLFYDQFGLVTVKIPE